MASALFLLSSRQKFQWAAALFTAAFALVACSKNKSNGAESDLLSLVFEGFQNAQGVMFEPGEPIEVPCDGRITVHLGPSEEAPHLLDHWELRPPGTCGDIVQCGFIELTLDYKDGTSRRVNRASLAIVLEEELVSPGWERITARLKSGQADRIYEVDGRPVQVATEVTLSMESCEGTGGAPGDGGMGGTSEVEGGRAGASFGGDPSSSR